MAGGRTDVKYDEELVKRIQELFINKIVPENFLLVVHKYDSEVLTLTDIERLRKSVERNAQRAVNYEILLAMKNHNGWFEVILNVCSDPEVKQGFLVEEFKRHKRDLDEIWPLHQTQKDELGSNFRQKPSLASNEGNCTRRDASNSGVHDNGIEKLCFCGIKAVLRPVKKEGPNKGREFYTCLEQNGKKCNFFLWADGNDLQQQRITRSSTTGVNTSSKFDQVQPRNGAASGPSTSQSHFVKFCDCGHLAVLCPVRKESYNKGRLFYGCRNMKCNFFKWADGISTGSGIPARSGFPTRSGIRRRRLAGRNARRRR